MKHSPIFCSALTAAPGVTLYHVGPALDHGPLPTLFYFSLSGEDSLCLDPYNQPVQFLNEKMLRVFSMTLPGHEPPLSPGNALTLWAEDMAQGKDCLGEFLDQIQIALDFAIREQFVDVNKLAVAGLSRGAFIGAHMAARDKRVRFLLGFAPLVRLNTTKEFQEIKHHPLVVAYDLHRLAEPLASRHIRLYIGNRDTRVGTQACFDFAMSVVSYKTRGTAQVDMIMGPSIGHMGHGTSPETFRDGANWIAECLK